MSFGPGGRNEPNAEARVLFDDALLAAAAAAASGSTEDDESGLTAFKTGLILLALLLLLVLWRAAARAGPGVVLADFDDTAEIGRIPQRAAWRGRSF